MVRVSPSFTAIGLSAIFCHPITYSLPLAEVVAVPVNSTFDEAPEEEVAESVITCVVLLRIMAESV
jgi:hypothetical protein